MTELHRWARALPQPKAVLIVSAHWESAPLSHQQRPGRPSWSTTSAASTRCTTDALRHPGRHRPRPAGRGADARLRAVARAPVRGLDHGAWVPLKIMYPEADIPVLQLSMPTHDADPAARPRRAVAGAARVRRAGHRLGLHDPRPAVHRLARPRRGARLVVGLRRLGGRRARPRRRRRAGALPPRAPGMPYAHPTVEHFTPLFVTLGAATDPDRAGHHDHRRVPHRAVEALVPGRLTGSAAVPWSACGGRRSTVWCWARSSRWRC